MNIILFVLDTLRADHLSGYGYARKTSPNIDALMDESAWFVNSSSAYSMTLPSFTSIVTGKHAANHRMVINPWGFPNPGMKADDALPTIAELLWDNGYVTAAVDNLIQFANHPSWFVKGYEYYLNATRTSRPYHHLVKADAINEKVLPWLKQHAHEKFFLFVHYWDPHRPYEPPPPFDLIHRDSAIPSKIAASGEEYLEAVGPAKDLTNEERKAIDLYDGEISFLDDRLGQIFDALHELGIYDDTAILITSDHGELMGERPDVRFDHRGVYHPTMYVPTIVRAPGLNPPAQGLEAFAHHVDLMPTVLDLAGVEMETRANGTYVVQRYRRHPTDATLTENEIRLDGFSLLPVIRAESKGVRTVLGGEGTYRGVPQRYVRLGQWKLIRNYTEWMGDITSNWARGPKAIPWREAPRLQLYDLRNDPEETVDLVSERPEVAQGMEDTLRHWLNEILDDPEGPDAFELRKDVVSGYSPWELH